MVPLIEAAHRLLIELDPDSVFVPRRGEKSLAWGVGPQKMTEAYCYLMPFREHVNLGCYHGAGVDTDGILEGTGAHLRHVKVSSPGDVAQVFATSFVAGPQRCDVLHNVDGRGVSRPDPVWRRSSRPGHGHSRTRP